MRSILRLARGVRPGWGRMALAAILGTAAVGANIGLMGTAALVIASAALHPSIAELQVAIVGIRAFGVARVILRYIERLVAHDQALRLLARLRSWLLEALAPLAPGGLVGLRRGDLLARLVGDVDSLQGLVTRGLAPILVAGTVVLGCLMLVGASSADAAAALGVVYLVAMLLVPPEIARAERAAAATIGDERARLSRAVVDLCDGGAELTVAGRGAEWLQRLETSSDRLQRAQRRAGVVAALEPALDPLLAHIAVWVLLVVLTPSVVRSVPGMQAPTGGAGDLNGITLAVLCLVVLASFEALTPLISAARELRSQREAASSILSIVDRPPPVLDPEAEPAPAPDGSKLDDSKLGGLTVELRGVSHAYADRDRPAVQGVDLLLEAGTTTALIGPSGSGKTTLARLIQRYWDPQQGQVLIDGRGAASYRLADLRRAIGALDQEPKLFAGTIRDNLLLADPGADVAQLRAALRSAAFELEREGLHDGLETWIGEHGSTLSGGQRQRLALARIALLDPGLLILDEPTTSLDPITESSVWTSLAQLRQGRTCLVISHRIRRVGALARVVVMDRGRIVQTGTHAELAGVPGPYQVLLEQERELIEE